MAFFETTLNCTNRPLYELLRKELKKGRYMRKIIRFKENCEDGRKIKHLKCALFKETQ